MKPKRIFISGPVSEPMREFGFLKVYNDFRITEKLLREKYPQAEIVNPMIICGSWSWLRCMIVCLVKLLRCDTICLKKGYIKSRGSRIEAWVAAKMHKTRLGDINGLIYVFSK